MIQPEAPGSRKESRSPRAHWTAYTTKRAGSTRPLGKTSKHRLLGRAQPFRHRAGFPAYAFALRAGRELPKIPGQKGRDGAALAHRRLERFPRLDHRRRLARLNAGHRGKAAECDDERPGGEELLELGRNRSA